MCFVFKLHHMQHEVLKKNISPSGRHNEVPLQQNLEYTHTPEDPLDTDNKKYQQLV